MEQALSLLENAGDEDGPEGIALQEQIAEFQGPKIYTPEDSETAEGWRPIPVNPIAGSTGYRGSSSPSAK